MLRVIIIGDVHGCIDELQILLEELNYNSSSDRVILAGDLVGKGKDGAEVIRFASSNNIQGIRGNHDDILLRYYSYLRGKSDKPHFEDPTHERDAKNMSLEDWQYLSSLPYYIRLEEYNCIIVHAGVFPGVELSSQTIFDITRMRNISGNGLSLEIPSEGWSWAQLWNGPEHIYYGHDARRGLQSYSYATCIDTGCCYGDKLTAVVLRKGRPTYIHSVEALKKYR